MTLFQWLTLGILGLLLLREGLRLGRGIGSRWFNLVRVLVWAGAAVAIADPDLINRIATAIGIGRGADVVLYVFVLVFLGTAFYFYARYLQVQQQLTQLVRHLAIREARRGPGPVASEEELPRADSP